MARALGKGGVAKLVWKSESGGRRVGKRWTGETSGKETKGSEGERERGREGGRSDCSLLELMVFGFTTLFPSILDPSNGRR